MGILPNRFLQLYVRVMNGGAEVTLASLVSDLELDDLPHTLDQIQSVRDTITECQLELIPDIASGDLQTTRVLRPLTQTDLTPEITLDEIIRGETSNQELKSSLIYNHERAAAQPGTPLAQLKSDDVTFSCLRTIGAFLSSFGGVLYVGVDNQSQLVGIEYDFRLLKKGKGNRDSWELYLRDVIQGRFRDGISINDYVNVGFVEIERKTLAKVNVLRRSKLSLLKQTDGCALFRRQGNRSVEVKMEDVEEFLELRKAQSET
ncbi:MAG: RNA-binding domain-containing protein [Dehalococcoidia bacterium]